MRAFLDRLRYLKLKEQLNAQKLKEEKIASVTYLFIGIYVIFFPEKSEIIFRQTTLPEAEGKIERSESEKRKNSQCDILIYWSICYLFFQRRVRAFLDRLHYLKLKEQLNAQKVKEEKIASVIHSNLIIY